MLRTGFTQAVSNMTLFGVAIVAKGTMLLLEIGFMKREVVDRQPSGCLYTLLVARVHVLRRSSIGSTNPILLGIYHFNVISQTRGKIQLYQFRGRVGDTLQCHFKGQAHFRPKSYGIFFEHF